MIDDLNDKMKVENVERASIQRISVKFQEIKSGDADSNSN